MSKFVPIKAGVWYTVSSFLTKGMAFIITPIITRLLTQTEYGQYTNYLTWYSIILVFTSLELHSSMTKAYYEYEDKLASYESSIAIFCAGFTLFLFIIVTIFKNFFSTLFDMDYISLSVLFLSSMFAPALSIIQNRNQMSYKYKVSSALSLLSAFLYLGGALLCVLLFSNKYYGVIIGKNVFAFVLNFILFVIIVVRGHSIKKEFIKYALLYSLPIILHVFARNLLQSSDKIMIQKMCGETDLSLYGVAYTCGSVVNILLIAMNHAFIPWLFAQMNKSNYDRIKEVSRYYVLSFAFVMFIVMVFTPEIVWIIGGEKYAAAQSSVLPILCSTIFQFIYTMYSNIESYYKKNIWLSVATAIAAVLNIILNYFLIPIFGYFIAAYTTLIGYIVMMLLHMLIVNRLIHNDPYDRKFMILVGLASTIFCLILAFAGSIRFLLLFGLCALLLVVFSRNRLKIEKAVKEFKEMNI